VDVKAKRTASSLNDLSYLLILTPFIDNYIKLGVYATRGTSLSNIITDDFDGSRQAHV